MNSIRHEEQRVGIFIDIQNLYHSAKNIYQARVNFHELIKEVTGGRKLIRAVAYVVKSEGVGPADEALASTGREASFLKRWKERAWNCVSRTSRFFPAG